MTFKFHSMNYPDAPDLTARSEKIGLWTSTLMSLVYAAIPAGIGIVTGNMDLASVCIVASVVLMIVLPIVLAIVRKNLFRKLDQEYAARKAAQQPDRQPPARQERTEPAAAKNRNVTIVLQRTYAEGPAACFCMIMDYYGKRISLDQACVDCCITENGCTAADVMRAAKRYGLPCCGFRKEAEDLRYYSAPVIIHWRGCQFVVLEEIQGDFAYFVDPASGRFRLNFAAFKQNYSGIVLTFE